MVITGATGAIGSAMMEYWPDAKPYDWRTGEDFPACNVLINCMGVNIDGKLHKIDFNDLGHIIETNLIDTLHVIQMALPNMRKQGHGRIINMSSMLANQAVVGTTAYTASKAGLNAAIKVIAKENAKHNVLINNLNLGYMDLGMTHKIPNYKKLKIPVGKFGHVWEIISACQFLIDSDYITGSCIDINGGLC